MNFIQVKVDIPSDEVESLIALLIGNDIDGYEIIDDYQEEILSAPDFEELRPDIQDMNGRASIIFYLEPNESGEELYKEISKVIKESFSEAVISRDTSREEDWRDEWKKYFHSFRIGDILVKPSWEEADMGDAGMMIEIDPGISFGTGSHETTRMCMENLSQKVKPGHRVLDIGCGSGILDILANRLGAAHTLCLDIDEDCILTTRENLQKNHCNLDEFGFLCGNILTDEKLEKSIPDGGFEVVVANILADIVIDMLPIIKRKLVNNGTLIASGIIEGKEEKVKTAMERSGFTVKEIRQNGEWFMIMGNL